MERLATWERLRRVNPHIWDGLLAVGMFGFIVLCELLLFRPEDRGVDDEGLVLIVVACASLAWRRRAPIAALAVTATAFAVYEAQGSLGDFVGIAFVIAVYSAAAYRELRLVLAVALPIAVATALSVYLTEPLAPAGHVVENNVDWPSVVFNASLFVGLPMVFGRFEFNRRRRGQDDRERVARDAVTDERARIARELHDVVAHAMSVMVVQAGAARVVIDRDPSEAAGAMQRIEDTGRMGLAEMRRLLGILDSDGAAAALVPQPGLERLDELLDTMRATGLPVEAMVEGTPQNLPPGVDLTAYRVVQEGLTNALKHAGEAHARVLLRYDAKALEVEIADDGRGPPPDGVQPQGHGLIGMRERVALFGGWLETGERPGGGFVVRARIPLVEAS